MSKKPSGEKGKNGGKDSNKGGKNGKGKKGDQNVVAQASGPKKVPRARNPKPDFTPRAKKAETVQTVEAVWNGFGGVVETHGMKFRVSVETTHAKPEGFKVVSVISAPRGTELAGVSPHVYVTVGSLHAQNFQSKLDAGTKSYADQKKLWVFFHNLFVSLGTKKVDVKKSAPQAKQDEGQKASESVANFISGVPGLYCFGGATLRVKSVGVSAPQLGAEGAHAIVQLVSLSDNHPLLVAVRKGTFIELSKVSTPVCDFHGSHAGDCSKLWEYLHDIVVKYHREIVQKIVKPMPSSEGLVVGAPVVVSPELLASTV